ncbi:MAG: dihydropteroate synthase [Candidatus Marinimicrobia bacterium]|nr:dihydropteroate synthase [Candidatus Neomarinimicrobiota bacterium]
MGIVNVTPDSFSDGGHFSSPVAALNHAQQLIQDGATIIDVGGESTRPGSSTVSLQQELDRVIPVIEKLSASTSCLISIDTQKSTVADLAIQSGAHIVNDVSSGRNDPHMMEVVARYKVPYVMMHMQGTPKSMQDSPHYSDVISEIKEYFNDRLKHADSQGINRSQIILDPGIGFGKSLSDNLKIMANIDEFHSFGCPLLIGASRKSFIDMIHHSEVHKRLGGSLAAALAVLPKNVQIYRVHDVFETCQALNIFTAIQKHLD